MTFVWSIKVLQSILPSSGCGGQQQRGASVLDTPRREWPNPARPKAEDAPHPLVQRW